MNRNNGTPARGGGVRKTFKSKKKENGTQDLFNWECGIPGPRDVESLLFLESLGRRNIQIEYRVSRRLSC